MVLTNKKIALALLSLCASTYLNANDSTVLSIGVTSNHSSYSYSGSENKTWIRMEIKGKSEKNKTQELQKYSGKTNKITSDKWE